MSAYPEEGIKLVTRKTQLNDGSRKNCLTAFSSQFNMVQGHPTRI